MSTSIHNANAFEYARELQLQEYLNQDDSHDEEPTRCPICGNKIYDECIEVGRGQYVCEECVEDEMSEGDYSRTDAIVALTAMCSTTSLIKNN